MYTDDSMLRFYIALGIFLLMAARNPSANRRLTLWFRVVARCTHIRL